MRIYLDHNATTPLAPDVIEAMADAMRRRFGNPSSVHFFGQDAKAALDDARSGVAHLLGAEPAHVVFTSGGTESDNFAIRGAAEATRPLGRLHLITTAIEHEAVLNTFKALARRGWETTILPVGQSGVVEVETLTAAIRPDTALVSIMYANNEVGTIQPIGALAQVAHEHGALFHTDAIQAVGKIPVDVQTLGVDLLSLSAHKFHGPKGVGALWIKKGTRVTATQTGGRQERGRRAGTENVPAIIGMGVAARLAAEHLEHEGTRLSALRDRLENGVLERVSGTVVNGARTARVPNTTNIGFEGIEAESLLIALDLEGIAVSTGLACSSGTLEPSHVLRAMGLSSHRTQNALRFSLGSENTDADIDRVLDVLPGVVERLRSLTGAGSRAVSARRA